MIARCCWCGSPFVRLKADSMGMLGDAHYWCQTHACRERQAAHALSFTDRKTGKSQPFYVPLPKQVEFDCAPVRYLLGGGAAGASKSHQARFGLYRRAFQIPGFEALILRRTWAELEKHHLRLMEREALKLRALGLPVTYSKTDRELRIHHGEDISVIEGGHMENPDDVEKYLSRERDAIVCDEAATFEPQTLLALSTRARSTKPAVAEFARRMQGRSARWVPPGGGAVAWYLSNPGGPAAPMLRDFCIDHSPNLEEYPQLAGTDHDGQSLYDPTEWGYIPGNLEDNPYLPASYERDLAVLQPWRYQQLRFNNWDVVAGQFFGEFDPRLHVMALGYLGEDVQWFRSMDYGFLDPNVTLWWAILPDGALHIKAEQRRQFSTIATLAKDIRTQSRELGIRQVRYTVADKFSMGERTNQEDGFHGETRAETFRAYGVPVTTTNQSREIGWSRVREFFALRPDGRPWLTLDPSCRYLIRAITAAVADKARHEDIAEFKDDHPLDALRLGVMTRPSPRKFTAPPLPKSAVGHLLREVQAGQPKSPLAWR